MAGGKIVLLVGTFLLAAASQAHAVQATLNWSSVADPNRTGVRVERQDGGAGAFVAQGPVLGPDVTVFNQPGLAVGTQYCYRVVPVGDLGDGPALSACGTPNTPGALGGGLTIIFAP